MSKNDLGNPALVAAAANVVAAKQQNKANNNTPVVINPPAAPAADGKTTAPAAPIILKNRRHIPLIGGLIVGGVVIIGGISLVKNSRKKKILNEVDTNANYRAAQTIYNAIPDGLKKGNGSLFSPFGFVTDIGNKIALMWQSTDTNRILDIAKTQITNYDETLKAFRVLYGEDLSALLNKVLTMQELNNFYDFSTAYKASQREINTSQTAKTGYVGVITKETYVLSTWYNPKTQAVTSKLVQLNKLLPKNTGVGKYTGREVNNLRANDNTTYYVFVYGKTSSGNVIHIYAPKSAVKFSKTCPGCFRIHFANYKTGSVKSIG